MARGRKPKPIEIRDAEGNPARRQLPAPLIRTEPLQAQPPALLGDAGAELWRELVSRLGSVGALDQVDRVQLTAMCIQWDLAEDARQLLASQGLIARGSRGQLVSHPAYLVMTRAHQTVLKFAGEFAATPVARARVATAKAQATAAAELRSIVDGDAVEVDDVAEDVDFGAL